MEGSVCFGVKSSVLSSFATLSVETISGPKKIVHSCSYEHEDLGLTEDQSGGPGLETVFIFLYADSSRTLYDIVLATFQLELLVALVVILDVVQRRVVIARIVVLVKIKGFRKQEEP